MTSQHPPLRPSPTYTSQREMAFTFANLLDCKSSITDTLTKQFHKRYIGFYLSLTFKSVHCVEASRNRTGLVGTIFLTFQVDSSVGFGESTIIVTQVNVYQTECISVSYTGDNQKQLAPLLFRIQKTVIEQFMIINDPDTIQQSTIRFVETIQEELCAVALHPDRMSRLIQNHGIEILNNM